MKDQLHTSVLLFLAALLLCSSASSSSLFSLSDSSQNDTSFVHQFKESEFLADTFKKTDPLVFRNFHRYLPQDHQLPYLGIGNPGHALYSPVYSGHTDRSINSSLFPAYYQYMRQAENMNYYRNSPPLTTLFYVSGAKKEEFFDVAHARNFGTNLNMSVHLIRQGSEGFYNHLKSKGSHFDINTNYNTTNHRYTLISHYYYNKRVIEENGGYEDFASIENPETSQSSRLDFALNEIREEGVLVGQTIGFGKIKTLGDGKIIPLFRIGHDLNYKGGYRWYYDQALTDTSIYKAYYYDSTLTSDSILYNTLSNQFNLSIYPLSSTVKFFYRNELIDYEQSHSADTVYTNHYAGMEITTSTKKRFVGRLQFEYGLSGYDAENMNSGISIEKQKVDSGDIWEFHLGINQKKNRPLFYYQRYFSNNVLWLNNFDFEEKTYLDFHAGALGYAVEVEVGNISNYIYFNEQARPDQFNQGIQYFSLGLRKLLNWKSIYLDNRLRYQQFSEHNILPLPNFLVWESLYLQGRVFNKVLEFQVGFDVFYYQSHYAYAYTPVLGQFYLQQRTKQGNYPYIDVFLNARLKRAFFFVKMSHFNKGMAGDNYFQVPDYPAPGRSFKFGIRWVLFD